MKYISLFSGVEAATVAWKDLGWEAVAFSEIDQFPSAVLQYHYPDVPNLGDITQIDWKEYAGTVELVVGGSPCFPGDVLVTTSDGCKRISSIKPGDLVLTHKGRFRKVLKVGNKYAPTVILKGQGHYGIHCTRNHPFLSVEKQYQWHKEVRRYTHKFSEPEWTNAEDMAGRFWQNLCMAEDIGIPELNFGGHGQRNGGYIDSLEMTDDFFYFVGRWLGDGWLNVYKRKNRVDSKMKRVFVCCPKHQREELAEKLSKTGLHFTTSEERTTTRFCLSSTQIYDWLLGNFGSGADGKFIPGWCLGMSESKRKAMLQGYFDADGSSYNNGFKTTTVSKALAIGLKQLGGSLGYYVSMVYHEPPGTKVIEGREVHQKPQYILSFAINSRSAVANDNGYYGLVRSVQDAHRWRLVYNLEVDEDNSYCADGIAVHNCQSFSIAGDRSGLSGESGLMFEYIRAVQEVRPKYFIWENVIGAFTSEHGGAFRQLLSEMDALGYNCAWRLLDAQFFGVPQRRRRVFVVGSLGNESCAEVLFERESLCWDYPTSARKRQALTERLIERSEPCGESIYCLGDANGKASLDQNMCGTLKVGGEPPIMATPKLMVIRAGKPGGGKGPLIQDNVSGTLAASGQQTLFQPTYCIQAKAIGRKEKNSPNGSGYQQDISYTLTAVDRHAVVAPDYIVRKLTPLECERLQGFPTKVNIEVENMTSDELIAIALANGDIFCDHETGEVYGTRGPGGIKLDEPRVIGFQHPSGYIHINLSAGGAKKQVRAHRVVWISGSGAIPDGYVIDHINNNKTDNRLCNLQAIAPEENSHKAKEDGLYPTGDEHRGTKITAEIRTEIMHDYQSNHSSYREIAEKYGISKSRVGQLVHEYGWTQIPYKNKPAEECPDAPRYKAMGNSMAVPVMRWIGERLDAVERRSHEAV